MKLSDPVKGYLSVVLAAVLWGTSGTTGKALFSQGMSPFELVQIRVALSSLILLVFLAGFDRQSLRFKVKDLWLFLLLGGAAMAMVQGMYFYAISKIQVAAAILLEYMAPIMVTAFSVIFWQERLTRVKAVSLFGAFFGCYLMVSGHNLELLSLNRLGVLGGFAAAVSFAAYSLIGERLMREYKPRTVLFYAILFSAVTWHIIYPPFHYVTAGFSADQWIKIGYIALFGTAIPFGLFYLGINYIRAARASITAIMEPISAGVFAYLFLGETMAPLQLAGGVMAVVAVVLLGLKSGQASGTPESLRLNDQGTSGQESQVPASEGVILLHGLGRHHRMMEKLQNRFGAIDWLAQLTTHVPDKNE